MKYYRRSNGRCLTVTGGIWTVHSCQQWTCSRAEDRVPPGSHCAATHSPPHRAICARRSSSLTTGSRRLHLQTATCQPTTTPSNCTGPRTDPNTDDQCCTAPTAPTRLNIGSVPLTRDHREHRHSTSSPGEVLIVLALRQQSTGVH